MAFIYYCCQIFMPFVWLCQQRTSVFCPGLMSYQNLCASVRFVEQTQVCFHSFPRFLLFNWWWISCRSPRSVQVKFTTISLQPNTAPSYNREFPVVDRLLQTTGMWWPLTTHQSGLHSTIENKLTLYTKLTKVVFRWPPSPVCSVFTSVHFGNMWLSFPW